MVQVIEPDEEVREYFNLFRHMQYIINRAAEREFNTSEKDFLKRQ